MSEYALRLASSQDTAARVRAADLLGLVPAGALTARTGVRPGPTAADVAVSAGTMNVTVQPFIGWVQGGSSVGQGGYVFVLDAAKTLTVANGHASLSRTDVVVVRVRDTAFDGSGSTDALVTIVQGTAGAGVPALPTNCLPLRNITVPANLSAGTGGLTSGNLSTDRRTYLAALGGVVPVASTTERDAMTLMDGLIVYRKDASAFDLRAGGAWHRMAVEPAADGWHTVGSGGEPAFQNGFSVAFGFTVKFRKDSAGNVHVRGMVSGGTSGAVAFTLPAGYRPTSQVNVSPRSNDPSGFVTVDTAGLVNVFYPGGTNSAVDMVFSTA